MHSSEVVFKQSGVRIKPSLDDSESSDMFFFRGTVHQSFPDFTFLTGNWIGKLMKLKGEIDPELAIDLCNKATLAFLQRHLGKIKSYFTTLSFPQIY